MRIKEMLKKAVLGNWRQKLTAAASVFIVYVIMLTGIFSYFHSEDVATNRLQGASGSVTVHEPKWDSEGQYMARASEPGMAIPKNPYGVNDGQVDLYIRLKMTVALDPFESRKESDGSINSTYNNSFNDNTGKETEHLDESAANAEEIAARRKRRLNSILNAVKVGEGSSATDLFKWANTEGDISVWTLKPDEINNGKFVMQQSTSESSETSLVFYFYYTDGDTDNNMKEVSPGASTRELFNKIDIPIYKKDYLGVFDQNYSITIEAEGIPSGNYPRGLTASAAVNEFNK